MLSRAALLLLGALLLCLASADGRASGKQGAIEASTLEKSPASPRKKHVVLLYDERTALPGLSVIDASFVRTLTADAPGSIEIYREEMDLSRFESEAYLQHLREHLRVKYADEKIDVAIAVHSPALEFLLSHGDEIFPGTPIVFSGVDTSQLHLPLPPHVTGVLVKRQYRPTLELALGLHPNTKRVMVVAGTSDFDTQLVEEARKEFRAYEDRLTFEYPTTLSLQQLLGEVSQLPPQTIILYTTIFQDGDGQPFVPHDVVRRLSDAANAPVYGFVDQFLGRGIVGGSLYSVATHGRDAAKLTLRVLAGEEPSQISPFVAGANQPMFDWRQMRRWGIAQADLPSGAVVRFRPQTAWEQYRSQLIVIAAVLLAQTVLIGGLLYERHRRRLAEVEAQRLGRQLLAVQEEERRRIASELHDSTQQHLVAVDLNLAHLSRIVAGFEKAEQPIQQIKTSLRDAQHELRVFTYLLYPPNLREEGLKETVEKFVVGFSRRADLKGETRIADDVDFVPYPVQRSTLRVVQEALANVHRHADATRFSVEIDVVESSLYVHVSDNGRGMKDPLRGEGTSQPGVGIPGMRARVAQFSGELRIDSGAHGTSVIAKIPLIVQKTDVDALPFDEAPPIDPDIEEAETGAVAPVRQ